MNQEPPRPVSEKYARNDHLAEHLACRGSPTPPGALSQGQEPLQTRRVESKELCKLHLASGGPPLRDPTVAQVEEFGS
jgi:hypothetical protein